MENTTTLLPNNGTHNGLHTVTTSNHRGYDNSYNHGYSGLGFGLHDLLATNNQSEISRDTLTAIADTGRDGIASTERNGGETRAALARESAETRANADRGLFSVLDKLASNNVTVLLGLAQTQKDVAKEACDTREKSAAQFAALQLQACKDTAELARHIAECCCEQKELIRAEGTATRELIQVNVSDALRAKITELATANTILQLGENGRGNQR